MRSPGGERRRHTNHCCIARFPTGSVGHGQSSEKFALRTRLTTPSGDEHVLCNFRLPFPRNWLNLLSAEEVVEPLGGGQPEPSGVHIIGEGRLNGFVSFC